MATQKTSLDPVLRQRNIHVEPEELVDEELEVAVDLNQGRLKRWKNNLSLYGNRVLMSGQRFLTAVTETLGHIGTALAGSIVLLPLVILARGFSVLLNTVFSMFKPLVLSFFRLIFDALRGLVWPLHELFGGFNKKILFPLLKRIKEDDTTALIAFVVLLAVIGLAIFAATQIF